ncbi:MAG: PQQ-binding-like beta-propeller repeat protein [Caldilineaceae bacterium]|nr:PQQ-binding-like beta-propeller repeat protein [Caldilineaceae bacterium]
MEIRPYRLLQNPSLQTGNRYTKLGRTILVLLLLAAALWFLPTSITRAQDAATPTPTQSTSSNNQSTENQAAQNSATATATRPALPTPRETYSAQAAEITPEPTTTESAALGDQAAVQPTPGIWPVFSYNYEQTRHVPLSQITRDNVNNLGRVWSVDFQRIDGSIPGGQETYPLMVNGKLYATTSFNHGFAMDAATGEVLWHFAPDEIGRFQNFGLNVNRGFGYCDGTLFMLTLDMRIMAIDAETGELVQAVEISDAVPDARAEFGYYQTHAPICYQGILVIGSSGGDNGVRGFVMAYNASDLSPAWPNPYWTVPPADQDWRSEGRFHGGGAVWMSPTIDTQTETLFFSVANPSPDFFPQLRPGNNPKTNSVVAVDLLTGEEKWWQQQLTNDQWDYDTSTSPMVYTARVNGEERRVVSVGTKQGYWFAYDAESGDPIYEQVNVVDTNDHPELVQGEPIPVFPSALGGVNYSPQSYDPTTNYAFVAAVESKTVLIQARSAEEVDAGRARGDVDTGAINSFGTNPRGWHDYGSVSAIDLNSGETAWKFRTAEPERGGVTTTDTGLGFVGGGDGYLRAFDTETGAILWQFQTGAPIAAAPTIYEVDGIEYVALAVGGTSTTSGGGKVSQMMVFALGGDPMQFAPPGVAVGGQSEEEIAQQASNEEPDLAQFISIDEQEENKVNITVIAAFDATNGGLNFNGHADGGATYRVPAGTTVEVTFRNLSTQSPHSAMVVPDGNQESVRMPAPVFNNASTPNPESGITSGTQVFTFTATEEGRYMLACGIPGHAQAGHWIWFEVGPSDSQPSYQVGDQEPYVPGAASDGGGMEDS